MYLDDPFDGVAAEAGSAVFAGYMVPRVYTVRHRQTEIKGRTSSAKDNISEGGTTETLQQTKKLKALDRLAVRSTTTITKTTPQASVEVMIDLLPIELMVQKVGISAYM